MTWSLPALRADGSGQVDVLWVVAPLRTDGTWCRLALRGSLPAPHGNTFCFALISMRYLSARDEDLTLGSFERDKGLTLVP